MRARTTATGPFVVEGMLAVLMVALVGGSLAAPSSAAAQDRVQLGARVDRDTVTVGDPFRVTVRVRAPRESTIEFPEAPDSGTGVEALDPVEVTPVADTTAVEQTATWRVAAWDTGDLSISFADIIVTIGDTTRRVAIGSGLTIHVKSVLPPDTALHVPKPPRDVIEFGLPWWFWALVALAALMMLLPLIWWWRRRRPSGTPAADDPHETAIREFARIDALGLHAAGERGQYVALVVDVVRTYLSRVVPPARISSTTAELASAMRGDSRVPLTRLVRLLHDADLVKFAAEPVAEDDAAQMAADARRLVDDVHSNLAAEVVRKAA
ncbi:MAG: hypothetical protein ACT4OZ_09405 [Gemmatimonadota bacterium]